MKRGKFGNKKNSRFESDVKIKLLPDSKRSQITVFVIIAIIIVISLMIYFSVKSGVFKTTVNLEIRPVYSFVDNCLSKTSEDAIYHIGQYGGYFIPPNESTESKIPYYFDKGKNLLLSKAQIEKELSKYVDSMMFFCVKNFADFPDFNVKQGEIKTETKILPEKVVFNLYFPLTISKGESSFSVKDFNTEVNSRLDSIYEVASGIIEEQMKDERNICINCIGDLAFEKKIFVGTNEDLFDKNTIIFSLIDDQEKINEEEYVFYFANRYELK